MIILAMTWATAIAVAGTDSMSMTSMTTRVPMYTLMLLTNMRSVAIAGTVAGTVVMSVAVMITVMAMPMATVWYGPCGWRCGQ